MFFAQFIPLSATCTVRPRQCDVEWIKFIRRLKETGMLLKDIKYYSELRYAGISTMPERLEILQLHRNYVLHQQLKWNEYLQNLDHKIAFYQESIIKNHQQEYDER